jgi:hypothetical protein
MAETNLLGLYKFYIGEFVFTGFYTEAEIGNRLVRPLPYISVLNLCINAKAGEIAGNYILIIASFQISSKRIFLRRRQSENNISRVLMSSPYFSTSVNRQAPIRLKWLMVLFMLSRLYKLPCDIKICGGKIFGLKRLPDCRTFIPFTIVL